MATGITLSIASWKNREWNKSSNGCKMKQSNQPCSLASNWPYSARVAPFFCWNIAVQAIQEVSAHLPAPPLRRSPPYRSGPESRMSFFRRRHSFYSRSWVAPSLCPVTKIKIRESLVSVLMVYRWKVDLDCHKQHIGRIGKQVDKALLLNGLQLPGRCYGRFLRGACLIVIRR